MDRIFCGRRQPDEQQQPSEERVNFSQLQSQEEIAKKEKEKQVFKAIAEKDIETLRKLINEHPGGVNIQEAREGKVKKTVLHCMADMTCKEPKEKELIKEMFKLLQRGCSVNAVDNYGNTPVKLAAEKGNIPILKLLLDNGADLKMTDQYSGDIPLHWAAKKGKVEAVDVLIQKDDTTVNKQNKLHKTPLHLAVEEKQESTVLLLLHYKADRDLIDQEGASPLRHAEINNFSEIEALLKEPSAKFKGKPLLLRYALDNNYPDIAKLLKPSDGQSDGGGDYVLPLNSCETQTSPQVVFHINLHDNAQAAIGSDAKLTNNYTNCQRPVTEEAHQPLSSSLSYTPSTPQEEENPTRSAQQVPEKDLSPFSPFRPN